MKKDFVGKAENGKLLWVDGHAEQVTEFLKAHEGEFIGVRLQPQIEKHEESKNVG